MIGKLLDYRYKVIRVLATGGFGETYIAEDTKRPGNPVCVVKHLKPASSDSKLFDTAKRLFQSEAETLEKLGSHDQIPRLLAYFVEHQEFYLVQEFIEGHTLSEELVPGEKWDEPQATLLLYEILSILEFVHQEGVIHRDIKPDNIIRRRSDHKLVLVDFGAVKQLRGGAGYPARGTVIGGQASATVAIGTPGYMPTEQGQGKPRPNSDLYALGIIAAQALTGIAPMDLQEDIHSGEILWQHLTSVSPEFAAILNKMIRYHFKERYQNATQALQVLQSLGGVGKPNQYGLVSSYQTSYPLARYTSLQSRQKTVAVAPGNQMGKPVNADVKPMRKAATGPDLLQIFILLLLAGGAAVVAPAVVKNVQGLATNWTKGNNTIVSQNCLAMTDESANIRSEPSSISADTILQTVSDRTALEVTGTRTKRGWLQVRMDSGKIAWVHSEVIGNNEEWVTCLRDKGIAMKTVNDNNLIVDNPTVKPKTKPVINLNPFAQNPEPLPTPTQKSEKPIDPVQDTQVVQEAREKYESGDLQGAIALLKSVPAGIEETSKMVSQWQQDWSKAEALFKDIDAAVASGNWDQVNSYKEHPEKLPNIQYWRNKIDPLVQQAADNISKQAENLTKQQLPKVIAPVNKEKTQQGNSNPEKSN
ncbi:serine/threonine protein kinase [Calothrix sp. PCC 6303]|uniref:serine/threonine protein kinase n=1 Tax=Calothrix sp. PCC 6303 TaxID=1170562 RepID=UPI0002A02436|nr:serine/threonine protein kinase [Calothrix sp. PCC 6303]AFZ02914.1 serine/threonine protein kinase [Calothrix sp. PCC 6303]